MNLNIKKSYFTILLVFGAHLGGMLIVLSLPLMVVPQVVLLTMTIASLAWQVRRGDGFRSMHWRLVDDGSGARLAGGENELRYRVTRAVCDAASVRLWLRLENAQTRLLVIARDALDADCYRELRARIVQHRLPPREQDNP
jgi:hypothetical protein